jgi:D-galactarolactone cycloisomerase
MKITSVETYPVQAPVARSFKTGTGGVYTKRTSFLVRVLTDEGMDGWGETDGPPAMLATGIHEVLEPLIVGKDPFHSSTQWAQMWHVARRMGTSLVRAIGAIDIALWDLRGKAVGQSVSALMGAKPGGGFPAVATGIFYPTEGRSAEPRVEEALRLAADGYRAVKIKVGALSPDEDIAHVAAIRKALPSSVMVAVDANGSYRARTAMRVARALEELGVYWFEEPIPMEETGAYGPIAGACTMWIAGGQSLPLADAFLPLLESRALHFVQPNIAQVGGFTEAQRLVGIARSYGAYYSPTGWGTGVTIAASLQMRVAASPIPSTGFPDLDWMEYDITDNPLREQVLATPIVPTNGELEAPSGPGLGIEVDLAAIRSFNPFA